MRDIKLRWFVEDDFVYTDRLCDLDFDCFINVENGEICLLCEVGDDFFGIKYEKADNRTREQFTGLKDINGIDIYEGDIITNNSRNFIVSWDCNEFRWETLLIGKCYEPHDSDNYFCDEYSRNGKTLCGIKVIGNIHQNKEIMDK